MKYHEFMHTTPTIFYKMLDAYYDKEKEKYREREYFSWLDGYYTLHAIASCFGKNHQYPENPMKSFEKADYEERKMRGELTEEEKLAEQKRLFMRFETMRINMELEKQRKEIESQKLLDANGQEIVFADTSDTEKTLKEPVHDD